MLNSENHQTKLNNLKRGVLPKINKFDCDFLLVLVLIMKIVPYRWFVQLSEQYQVTKKKCYNLITVANKFDCLMSVSNISNEKMLYLTEKGYNKAIEQVRVNYNYKAWTKEAGKFRSSTIQRDHHYILFHFFVQYLGLNLDAEIIYTDYDQKSLIDYVGGKDVKIRPDGVIRPKENYQKLICVEADTGTESHKKLFYKLLKYIWYAKNNFGGMDGVQTVELYFSFHSRNRLENILTVDLAGNKGNLFKFFANHSYNLPKSKEKIYIEDVYKVLRDGKLNLQAGVYSEGLEKFEPLLLWRKILEANPKWSNFHERDMDKK